MIATDGESIRNNHFPLKLHAMLDHVEKEHLDYIVSWLPDGTAFKVHRPREFVSNVMPAHFSMTKYKSFLRQLNIWNFSRVRSKGPAEGGYTHDLFVRGKLSLCSGMKRIKIKGLYKRGSQGSRKRGISMDCDELGNDDILPSTIQPQSKGQDFTNQVVGKQSGLLAMFKDQAMDKRRRVERFTTLHFHRTTSLLSIIESGELNWEEAKYILVGIKLGAEDSSFPTLAVVT